MKGVVIAAAVLAACSAAAPEQQPAARPSGTIVAPVPAATPTPAALPADVTGFRARRDSCDQLRGEDPYNAARARQLERAVKAACTGTDSVLAALKAKYRGNPRVTAALAGYEEGVE